MSSWLMAKRQRSPQEKKRISLRDRLGDARKLDKPWRKERTRRRARAERAYRHQVKHELQSGADADPGGLRRKKVYKDPGQRLSSTCRSSERQRRLQDAAQI
jgi:hypothetical protein